MFDGICGLVVPIHHVPLPVKSASLECEVTNLGANVISTMVYTNIHDSETEAKYVFPLDEGAAVYHFEATILDRKIIAMCRPKPEAKSTYEEAVAAGHAAILAEGHDHSDDVFMLSIGNVPAKTDITIILKYAALLDSSYHTVEDKTCSRLTFTLPSVLNPRYSPDEKHASSGFGGQVTMLNSQAYTLNFAARIYTLMPILQATSPRDVFKVEYESTTKNVAKIAMTSPFKPDHDLQLVIDLDGQLDPILDYEGGLPQDLSFLAMDCVGAHFVPDLGSDQLELRNEIVFLIDRSGSMSGANIEYAKESLLLLLKSLPQECRLQVIGFGSTYEALFPEPVDYTEATLNRALEYQANMDAGMGGTEVFQALKFALDAPLSGQGWYRQIIFLTDGDVSNTDQVVGLVRCNRDRARVFAIGIGQGASTALVSGVARSGRGTAAFVRGGSDLRSSVMKVLNAALQPRANNASIQWNLSCLNEAGESSPLEVLSIPAELPPILSGCAFTVFALFKKPSAGKPVGDVTLKFELQDTVKTVTTQLNKVLHSGGDDGGGGGGMQDAALHRLAAKCQIRELTDKCNAAALRDNQPEADKATTDNDELDKVRGQIEQVSLQTNVMSKFTALVGVDPSKTVKPTLCIAPVPEATHLNRRRRLLCSPIGKGAVHGSHMPMFENNCCFKRRVSGFGAARTRLAESMQSAPPQPPPPAAAQPLPASAHPPSPIKKKASPSPAHVELSNLLNFAGHWNADAATFDVIGISQDTFKTSIPPSWPGESKVSVSETIWITALVLAYLQSQMAQFEEEWRLVSMKARAWLTKQSKSSTAMEQLLQAANETLQRAVSKSA